MRLLLMLLLIPVVFSYNCPAIVTTKNLTIDASCSAGYSVTPPVSSYTCAGDKLTITFNASGAYNITYDGAKTCRVDVIIGEYSMPVPEINPILSIVLIFASIAFLSKKVQPYS